MRIRVDDARFLDAKLMPERGDVLELRLDSDGGSITARMCGASARQLVTAVLDCLAKLKTPYERPYCADAHAIMVAGSEGDEDTT
jgi:hypothetical protein